MWKKIEEAFKAVSVLSFLVFLFVWIPALLYGVFHHFVYHVTESECRNLVGQQSFISDFAYSDGDCMYRNSNDGTWTDNLVYYLVSEQRDAEEDAEEAREKSMEALDIINR